MVDEPTFTDFYKKLGLNEYPFAQWSAEQELRRKELFIRPTYYGPIDEKFRAGAGMFLVGERGTGKTAALYDLINSSRKSDLVVEISDFGAISTKYNPYELYQLIASQVTENILKYVLYYPHCINRLPKSQRLLLSYAYSEFTSATTKAELRQNLERLQAPSLKRLATKIYNTIRFPLNIFSTLATNFVTELIARSTGVAAPTINPAEVREFFPDIPFRVDDSFNSLPASLHLVTRLSNLAKELGLTRLIVIIDKLDEDARLEGDAEKIAEFVRGVITETSLHLSDNIQIVASIWSVPFAMLQKTENIRTQKMNIETLSWDRLSLERALNKRLQVFSSERLSNYNQIFEKDVQSDTYDLIFHLANKNPRDLWHAFDYIIKEQFGLNPTAKAVSTEAINKGLQNSSQASIILSTIHEKLMLEQTIWMSTLILDTFSDSHPRSSQETS